MFAESLKSKLSDFGEEKLKLIALIKISFIIEKFWPDSVHFYSGFATRFKYIS